MHTPRALGICSAGLGSAHGDWHSFDGRRTPSCGSVDAELME